MTEENNNRRASLRSRPPPRLRPVPRAGAVILYTVGLSIPKSDRTDLQSLLDEFHANEELQDLCATVDTNARRYLILVQDDQQDQKYKSVVAIPAGTLLAVYFGSLERIRPGEEDSLNHSMALGR